MTARVPFSLLQFNFLGENEISWQSSVIMIMKNQNLDNKKFFKGGHHLFKF